MQDQILTADIIHLIHEPGTEGRPEPSREGMFCSRSNPAYGAFYTLLSASDSHATVGSLHSDPV